LTCTILLEDLLKISFFDLEWYPLGLLTKQESLAKPKLGCWWWGFEHTAPNPLPWKFHNSLWLKYCRWKLRIVEQTFFYKKTYLKSMKMVINISLHSRQICLCIYF
jgi:hypothetical protein